MSIQILRPSIDEYRRILVISDINGNYELFCKLLESAKLSYDDIVVLNGDIIGNGKENLATIRLVIEMLENYEVYCILGNNDLIYRELLREDRNEELLASLLQSPYGLVQDMCNEQGILLRENTNMLVVKNMLRNAYEEELTFLSTWPHIVAFGNFVFAHAQILPGELEALSPAEVVRGDAFLDKGYSFDNYVVVGHWPVMLYDDARRCSNPIINKARKIISIDGGYGAKRDGQMNLLVIPHKYSDEFSFAYEDGLPKAKVCNTQSAGDFHNTITWRDNLVKPLQYVDEFAYCRQESSGKCFWIPEKYLTEREDGWHTDDFTDYQIRLTLGDVVSIIEDTSRGYIVKKDGITGWYYGMLETIE